MDKTCFHLRDLENKWVLVTGAASGIGNAVCLAFMTAGAGVVAVDIDDTALRAVAWRDYHAIFKADVVCDATLSPAFAFLESKGSSLDIVVNCAGVASGHPFESLPASEWDRVVGINLKGSFNVAQQAGRHFIKHGKQGSIILMGSISGMVANGEEFQNAHYCASKGGVHMLARSLAIEWAKHGIRVNAIAPGLVYTPMSAPALKVERGKAFEKRHPLGACYPVDIVGPVLFLASEMSSKVTGHILTVDGGYTSQ